MASRRFILEKAQLLKGDILEIGSGKGYTSLSLARAGFKFAAIDTDRESLKITALNLAYEKLLTHARLYVMDGKKLTFPDHSFNSVVIVGLFHHISEIDRMLFEAGRVLRPNGKLVLADFNKNGMKVIDSVHQKEGRTHEDSGVSKDDVCSYFQGLDYTIRGYEDSCHWLLIAQENGVRS